MRNVFPMKNRMAVRTNYHQIFTFIIFSIFIYMMNAENFFNFIVSAHFTFFYKTSTLQSFSEISKMCISFWFSLKLSTTLCGTKAISFAWRSHKLLITCCTCKFLRSFSFLRTMITKSRTIFSFVATRRYVSKFFITNRTISFYLHFITFILACSRTIFKSFQTIFRHIQFFITKQTTNIWSFHYASN